MRDPFAWSIPFGRLFGITIRVHLLFPVVVLGLLLRAAYQKGAEPGQWIDYLIVLSFLFVSVLLHEFGHCFAARWVGGDASEVLLWPLGGLATVEVPHTPKANFLTAFGGPAVNLGLCLLVSGVLLTFSLRPNLDPRPAQAWETKVVNFAENNKELGSRYAYSNNPDQLLPYWQVLLVQFFWVNWFGFLLNVLLIGFPLDGGRMFQAALWPRLGYRESMQIAIFVGFVVMFLVGIYALIQNELLVLCLAMYIYFACKFEWMKLEHTAEDSLFGYDFSQGYTSLENSSEREQVERPRRRKQTFWQRFWQRRAARRMHREQQTQLQEEQRMDQLLEKIQREGKHALTDEEQRFLKRVADKYRNR
jgi:stage IV sporulation protein FB